MLFLNDLKKIYRTKSGFEITALQKINISFPTTGMVFLIGESGSGKSTLLNLIGGIDLPTEGEVKMNGESIHQMKDDRLSSYRNTFVGFIFQEFNLIDYLTVEENISLAMKMQNKKCTPKDVEQMLSLVNLEDYQNRKICELSGGQKQRVAIARALIKNPHIVIADEPTGAVDSENAAQIFDTLKSISKQKLVIAVSHDNTMVQKYADRIIELKNGEVVSDSGTNIKTGEIEKNYFLSSHLPIKTAISFGINNITNKKVQFLLIVLLSTLSLTLFGMVDIISSYDPQQVLLKSLSNSDTNSIVVKKEKYLEYINKSAWYSDGFYMKQEDIDNLNVKSGMKWKGIYRPAVADLNIENNYGDTTFHDSQYGLYLSDMNGFVEFTEKDLDSYDFKLLEGRLPDGRKDEVAVSKYLYESFKMSSYRSYTGPIITLTKKDEKGNSIEEKISWDEYVKMDKYSLRVKGYRINYDTKPVCDIYHIDAPSDLVGKTIFIGQKNYTITGIIDTGFDSAYYKNLQWVNLEREQNVDILQILRMRSIESEWNYGVIGMAFVGEGKIENLSLSYPEVITVEDMTITLENQEHNMERTYHSFMKVSDLLTGNGGQNYDNTITFFEREKDSLGKREIILPYDDMPTWTMESDKEYDIMWIKEKIASLRSGWNLYVTYQDERKSASYTEYEIIGYTYASNELGNMLNLVNLDNVIIVPDELYEELSEGRSGTYVFAMAPTQKTEKLLNNFINNSKTDNSETAYTIQGRTTAELDTLATVIKETADIFKYVSLVILLFVVMLFSNFMYNNANQNKHNFGVLRALGARNKDIFILFLSESILIACTNMIVTNALLYVVSYIGNILIMQHFFISLCIFQFTKRQMLRIMGLNVLIALSSCVIPTSWIMRKKAVELICR